MISADGSSRTQTFDFAPEHTAALCGIHPDRVKQDRFGGQMV
jgi:hypothetical protein